jgi:N-acetylmuramoyl-L-alanine amidase
MSYLIALDDGHGSATPGKRSLNIPGIGVIKENTFNRAVVNHLHAELKRCGFQTLLVAPTDADIPLVTRTAIANRNKADAYISVHYNAGGGSGIETFYYPGSSKGQKLANAVHKYVIQGTTQKNRGVKTGNLHVLRETKMPACLIEYGFMDDPELVEARRMIDADFQKECAVETAKGICEYFGVSYVPEDATPPVPADMYDLSYLKEGKLVGLVSSTSPKKISDKVAWAMGARANFVLLLKRGEDLRVLQKALNEMLSLDK